MILISAAISVAVCAFFVVYIIRIKQTDQAKVHKKIDLMIAQAEAERAEEEKRNPPKVVTTIKIADQKDFDDMTFSERVIQPMIAKVIKTLHQFTPSAIVIMLEDYIFRAGKNGVWSIQSLGAAWVTSIIIGILGAVFVIQKTNLFFTQQIVVVLAGALLGGIFPFAVLNSKINQRKKQLKKELPEFLDLLCVSVRAGLSFDGAVSKIVARMKCTLTDEFKHMQDDIRFGMTKQYALTQLAKRCDVEAIYLFTTSIIQAEKLGTNMSQTLRVQADNMRERHRQFVKAEAMKAPVKIIFPMVLFIFPSVFVVLLFPAIISLMKNLG
ncbi:MAG: type II secretion system F family protein [Selenomonadaceae bacterium]|nr:type II secretion system F family protein [Selenomonadaceae bacterium]